MVTRNRDINKRMNYFDRQFLRAQDFTDEQDYHLDRHRRHNRLLHTLGVAEGLEVTGTMGSTMVTVSAGTAIDASGREIVLLASQVLNMPEGISADIEIYIALSQTESDLSTDLPGVTGNTRITESPDIKIVPPDPKPVDGLVLAKITLSNGQLSLEPDNTVRTRAGVKGTIVVDDLTVRSLKLKRDGIDSSQWPKLSCSQANEAALENSSLRLDVDREIIFQGNGQIASIGDMLFLTGAPTAAERMRILAVNGNVGIGTPKPEARLHIHSPDDDALKVTNTALGKTLRIGVDQLGSWLEPTEQSSIRLNASPSLVGLLIDGQTGNVGIGTGTRGPLTKLEVSGPIYSNSQGANNFALNSSGANFGFISNPSAGVWSLGYGTNIVNLATPVLSWNSSGNVGIGTGTTAPSNKLHVEGAIVAADGDQAIKIGVPGPPESPPPHTYGSDGIRGEPNLWLDAKFTVNIKPGFQTPAFDIAERFKASNQIKPGYVVVFDEKTGAVQLCDKEVDHRAVGIASTDPAFILGMEQEQIPIALCGTVLCRVDADIAPIAVGDLLTTSPTKGHAQKVLDPSKAIGAILGKALGSLEKGKGKILVLVMLQ